MQIHMQIHMHGYGAMTTFRQALCLSGPFRPVMTFKAGCGFIWAAGMVTELAHKVLMRAVYTSSDRAGAQIMMLYFDGQAEALLSVLRQCWTDYGRTVRLQAGLARLPKCWSG